MIKIKLSMFQILLDLPLRLSNSDLTFLYSHLYINLYNKIKYTNLLFKIYFNIDCHELTNNRMK